MILFFKFVQAMASDLPVYYSCDDDDDAVEDDFSQTTASDQGLQTSPSRSPSLEVIFSVMRSFKYVTRPVIFLATKLVTLICSLPIGINALGPTPAPNSEQVLSCLERLKRLENTVEELKTKPARLTAEKERLLEHSMDRIKSVELDLDKTKKVLHATLVRQLEISELMDRVQQLKFCVSSLMIFYI